MPKTSFADMLLDWEKLTSACQANAADLPGLEAMQKELEALLAETIALGKQQDAQKAAVQQTTKEINDRLLRGRLLATRVRNGAKLHYGTRTEKVIEFGIRPFRKRVRLPKEPPVFLPGPTTNTST